MSPGYMVLNNACTYAVKPKPYVLNSPNSVCELGYPLFCCREASGWACGVDHALGGYVHVDQAAGRHLGLGRDLGGAQGEQGRRGARSASWQLPRISLVAGEKQSV